MKLTKLLLAGLSIIFATVSSAWADQPKPWQINFQEPASPVMDQLVHLHNGLVVMCFAVCAFVLILLLYVCFRFSAKRNPVPSKLTHNTTIEIIWTVVPIVILLCIIVPSWRIIHFMDKAHDSEITLKAIGYQWYWGYEYMEGEGKGIAFESYMKMENPPKGQEALKLQPGEPRNLETDTKIVLPINTNIKLLTTGADVIHAWAMPAFGVKMDAVPGRINETWFKIEREGDYYGQCSELCGSKHAFMPIHVHAVSKEDYAAWVKQRKAELGVKEETTEASAPEASGGNPVKPAATTGEKAKAKK